MSRRPVTVAEFVSQRRKEVIEAKKLNDEKKVQLNVRLPESSVASWHDRSADRRRGSHSTFVMRGMYPGVAAITQARALFPSLFERYTFPVVID